jgi:hypothetical protein
LSMEWSSLETGNEIATFSFKKTRSFFQLVSDFAKICRKGFN